MIEIIPNWHPFFVHFTVALLGISVIFFWLSRVATSWRMEDQWLAAGYWNLWVGVLLTVGTVIAGFFAYNSVVHDDPSHLAMTVHKNYALTTLVIYILVLLWSLVTYRAKKEPSLAFLIILTIAGIALMSTAWRGAEVVYRHGLGVMSLPKTDQHDHNAPGHGHGGGAASEAPKPTSKDAAQPEHQHEGSSKGGDHHQEGASSTHDSMDGFAETSPDTDKKSENVTKEKQEAPGGHEHAAGQDHAH